MRQSPGFRLDLVSWLTEQGSAHVSIPDYIDAFCRFLNAQGFGIRRCNLATQTVHPQMTAIRHVWSARAMEPVPIPPLVILSRRQYPMGAAMIDEVFFSRSSTDTPQYRASPFYVLDTANELYEPIAGPGEDQKFPVFHDLAREGCTAYFARNLRSFEGIKQQIGLATAAPGGLSEMQQEDLRCALGMFTLHLNTLMEYQIKNTLAQAYLGKDPGQRVCSGMISLGQVASIEAAIWFSDLRGFTTISDSLSPEQLVEDLNDYFSGLVSAIEAHGGEVLKFIGDAVLAVFPVAQFSDRDEACAAAVRAALDANRNLEELNGERRSRGRQALAHGIGLHFGRAQYGNIGHPKRLDFTLIGKEVNVASRIEGMCKQLGSTILCSETFAEAARVEARDLGRQQVRGVAEPVRVYAVGSAMDDAAAPR